MLKAQRRTLARKSTSDLFGTAAEQSPWTISPSHSTNEWRLSIPDIPVRDGHRYMTTSWRNRTLFRPWTFGECGMTFSSRSLILPTVYHILNTSERLGAMPMQDEFGVGSLCQPATKDTMQH